jgi:hypothetical protein
MKKLYNILTWNQFVNLYMKLINSSVDNCIYLRITSEMNEYGWTNYIKKFAEKAIERNEDAQQCLDLLFKNIYSLENEEMYFDECLFDVFINAGAKFPVDDLFNRKYTNTKYNIYINCIDIDIIERKYTLYDEVELYKFRGLLIDYLGSRNLINAKKYAKWENIVPNNIKINESYNEITEKRRLEILKFYSKYLQSIKNIYIII